MILIIMKFCELLLRISPRIINSLRSCNKHSKEGFLLFPNTSKLVKKNSAAPRFSNLLLSVGKSEAETLFLVFDILLQITAQICDQNSQCRTTQHSAQNKPNVWNTRLASRHHPRIT